MCKMARVATALIRIAVAVPVKSLAGVAKVAFTLINQRCLGYMDQAALGRSYTGTFCGDALVGAMAHSWRILVQGLTSLMFLCVHADEYVRPLPSPLVLVAHDKPASHPQQVHISVVGSNNMRISWVTDDRKAPSVVEYGKSPGKYTASATGDHTTYQYFFHKSGAIHHVTIGPLEPSTTYYYRCGKAGDEFSLRTPPATTCCSSRATCRTRTRNSRCGTRSAVDGDGGQPRDRDAPRRRVHAVRRLQRAVADAVRRRRLAVRLQPLLLPPTSRSRKGRSSGGGWSATWRASTGIGRRGCSCSCTRRGTTPTRRTRAGASGCAAPWRRCSTRRASTSSSPATSMPTSDSQGSMTTRLTAIGDGGNREGLALRFIKDHKSSHLSLFREASFGHGRLRIVNETSAVWTWHRNDDDHATVRDEVWLESLAAPSNSRRRPCRRVVGHTSRLAEEIHNVVARANWFSSISDGPCSNKAQSNWAVWAL